MPSKYHSSHVTSVLTLISQAGVSYTGAHFLLMSLSVSSGLTFVLSLIVQLSCMFSVDQNNSECSNLFFPDDLETIILLQRYIPLCKSTQSVKST